MTTCVWRKLCTLLLATNEFTNCSTPKPKVHRMWYDCFQPKPNVAKSAHLSTFGAESETEAEIRSTSSLGVSEVNFISSDRLFHANGPATLKLQGPGPQHYQVSTQCSSHQNAVLKAVTV